MIWVIILATIGVIIYFFLRDRDKLLETQVDSYGGMLNKYFVLIEWLTSEPTAKATKVTRDHVTIINKMPTTTTTFFITENFGGVEIEWNAQLGMMGNHRLVWNFPKNTSEEDMAMKIGIDLQNYEKKIF